MAVTINPVSEVHSFLTSSGRTVYVLNGQSGFDLDALIAACHDASCRPPTSGGTGGSRRRAGFSGVSAPRERGDNAPDRKIEQLDKRTMDKLDIGWEDLPTKKRAAKFVESWYQTDLPDGYTMKVKANVGLPPITLVEVAGTIHNEHGRQVGTFERTINFDDLGAYEVKETNQYGHYGPVRKFHYGTVVTHDSLDLEASAQGHGIADAMNAHAMEAYRKYGVDHIDVTAGYSVGGYTWAVAGFRIDDGHKTAYGGFEGDRHEEVNGLLNAGLAKLPQLVQEGKLNEEQHAQALKQINALREASLRGEDIQPIHIASLGEDTHKFKREGNSGDPYTTWLGKEMLLGTSWHGSYYLTKEPITASVTISFGQEFTMIEHTDTAPQEEGDINSTRDWAEVHAQVAEYVKEYGQKP